LLFVLLSIVVWAGWIRVFDLWALGASRAITSPALDATSQALSAFGSAELTAILLLALITGVVLWSGCGKLSARILVAFAVATAVELTLKFLLPQAPVPDEISRTTGEPLVEFPTPHPYPSGHMLRSVILYGAVMLLTGSRILKTACVLLLAAMAASRVYLGVHWATDVIGGALLGAAALAWAFYEGGGKWRSR
jgi:undecaprenyl-diphosphatase